MITLSLLRRLGLGLASLNFNWLALVITRGPRRSLEYLRLVSRLYRGYGLPSQWIELPWRNDLLLPKKSPEELFPFADFQRSPELLFPQPYPLSVTLYELAILCTVVKHLKPKRIVEFGTATGRTTINLAYHSPPECEVITVDLPTCDLSSVLFRNHPLKNKITHILHDCTTYNWKVYENTVDVTFIDASDSYQGVVRETQIAFSITRPNGIVFWHDYGNVEGRTRYLNELASKFPVYQIQDTTLACSIISWK